MSILGLGNINSTDGNVIGFQDSLSPFNDLPGDEVVIASYEPVANVTPLTDGAMGVGTLDPLAEIDHLTIMDGCNCAACRGFWSGIARMAGFSTDW